MLTFHRFFVTTLLTLTAFSTPASALETDQFTTPPHPLADFGPALGSHLVNCIGKTIETANARRDQLLRDAHKAPFGLLSRFLTDRANEIITPDYIAQHLYDDVGPGLPECVIEEWVVEASARPGYQFAIDPQHSIYGNLLQRPLMLQTLSPTINLYGVYLGTDKVGHFFQQGHEYYQIYRDEEKRGRSDVEATQAAVRLGIWQERGFYGEMMVGVYSNGDLAANFAGLMFYLNLTRPVEIRRQVRQPILLVNHGHWEFNPKVDPEFLNLFISDHMNEALNASRYVWYIREHVRQATAARASQWAEFYHTTYEQQARKARELATWNGRDYGHSGFSDVFTAADVCFPRESKRPLAKPATESTIARGS